MKHSVRLKQLSEELQPGHILLDVESTQFQDVVGQLLDALQQAGSLSAEHREEVFEAVLTQEAEEMTALGGAVSIPYVQVDSLRRPIAALARLASPMNLDAPDGRPIRFIFLLLGTRKHAEQHLEQVISIARMMADDELHSELQLAKSPEEIVEHLNNFLSRTSLELEPAAPVSQADDGLVWSGRLFGGMINDMRRRLPYYVSDLKDGLHSKSLASVLFLFFACIAPAVAFGGLMSKFTGGNIGAVEMIVATAMCGIIYALFSGQPLTILGGTGPLLVFTGVLYKLCSDLGLPFLTTYAWVGIWTAGFVVLIAITDGSALIRYCTRFTDEIFALLISAIFVYEAIVNVSKAFTTQSVSHYTALFSVVLAIGTFYIASSLRAMRSSRYLRHYIREFLADFGSVIAIASMALLAFYMGRGDLTMLQIPSEFSTTSGRDWVIPLFDPKFPAWAYWGAAIPALLGTVLIYLDQNITARLVNQADNKLRKGPAYHLDLFVVGILIGVCSMLGLPWLVAATVRSLNHIRSLATVDESVTADGYVREHIVHVRENRISALLIHLLVGCSLLLIPFLQKIPMAVLFGLFFFMGVTSVAGNQFFERLKLWLMEPALYPRTHYVRRVPLKRIHLFTAIQLLGLVVLWVVKTGPATLALLFPLFIAILVPLRMFIGRFFDQEDLEALDSEEEPEEEMFREAGA